MALHPTVQCHFNMGCRMDYYQRLLMEMQAKYPTLSKAMANPLEFMEDSHALMEAAKNKNKENEDESDTSME